MYPLITCSEESTKNKDLYTGESASKGLFVLSVILGANVLDTSKLKILASDIVDSEGNNVGVCRHVSLPITHIVGVAFNVLLC